MVKSKLQYVRATAEALEGDIVDVDVMVERMLKARTLADALDALDHIDATVQNWTLYIARTRRRLA